MEINGAIEFEEPESTGWSWKSIHQSAVETLEVKKEAGTIKKYNRTEKETLEARKRYRGWDREVESKGVKCKKAQKF